MVTEVKSPGSPVIALVGNAGVKGNKPAAATTADASVGPENVVQLTDLAARLQDLAQAVADVPVVDPARVNALRQAVASGNYQVDAEAVADKLIAMEGLLNNRSDT
jgi:negative regulator of flagellin synthesis FlgM